MSLWPIKPVDMTDEQLAEQRVAKSRNARASKRRQSGVRTREQYLAELKAKPKPWEGSGLSRWQWYRRNKVGSDATIVNKLRPHLVAAEQAEIQRRGHQEEGAVKMLREATEAREVGREEQGSSPRLRPHPVAREPHYLEAALNNWGKNALEKKSTVSAKTKKPWAKPMFGEELRDFAEFPLEANELAMKEAS